MAEEIIDLRDRIEKMRIQIENEATEQISAIPNVEVHQKTSLLQSLNWYYYYIIIKNLFKIYLFGMNDAINLP